MKSTKTYLPTVVQDIQEFNILCETYDNELQKLQEVFKPLDLLDLNTLTLADVEMIENMLHIPFRPHRNLETRKNIIKLLFYTQEKYNWETINGVFKAVFPDVRVEIRKVKFNYGYPLLIGTKIYLNTSMTNEGDTDLLRYILDRYIPYHVALDSKNKLFIESDYTYYTYGKVKTIETIEVKGEIKNG